MKKVYEAVLVREDGGDFDTTEYATLTEARRGLKKMIGGKPCHDAYIRCFEYDEYGDPIRVYDC